MSVLKDRLFVTLINIVSCVALIILAAVVLNAWFTGFSW